MKFTFGVAERGTVPFWNEAMERLIKIPSDDVMFCRYYAGTWLTRQKPRPCGGYEHRIYTEDPSHKADAAIKSIAAYKRLYCVTVDEPIKVKHNHTEGIMIPNVPVDSFGCFNDHDHQCICSKWLVAFADEIERSVRQKLPFEAVKRTFTHSGQCAPSLNAKKIPFISKPKGPVAQRLAAALNNKRQWKSPTAPSERMIFEFNSSNNSTGGYGSKRLQLFFKVSNHIYLCHT